MPGARIRSRLAAALHTIAIHAIASSALMVAPARAQEVGERMPPIGPAEWIQGRPVDWGDGKVYLLDLWGTWCQPCIALMPELSDLEERYRARGFSVIGYSWEPRQDVERFLARFGDRARYALVTDPEERLLQVLSEAEVVEGFPYSFLVGADGRVLWKGPGQVAVSVVRSYFDE